VEWKSDNNAMVSSDISGLWHLSFGIALVSATVEFLSAMVGAVLKGSFQITARRHNPQIVEGRVNKPRMLLFKSFLDSHFVYLRFEVTMKWIRKCN
jgi:hypothetical protein